MHLQALVQVRILLARLNRQAAATKSNVSEFCSGRSGAVQPDRALQPTENRSEPRAVIVDVGKSSQVSGYISDLNLTN